MDKPRYEEFGDFGELVRLLKQLYRRPRRSAPQPHTPPIIACVQAEGDPRLLAAVAELLTPGQRHPVPHARVDANLAAKGAADDVTALLNGLAEVADQLARDTGGAYRFPRFRLAQWLMDQKFEDMPAEKRIAELRLRLRHRAVRPLVPDNSAVADALPSKWVRALIEVLTPLYLWVLQSGLAPGFGRRYRWFLRHQPNLASHLDRTFFSLAERLTDGQWQRANPEPLRRLLVNAFLEDLREAFRSIGWVRRYRTTVPIVLLDNVTAANGGETLIRTVSAVRNDTGLFDPLLLVTAVTEVPDIPDLRPNTVPRGPQPGSVLDRRNGLPANPRERHAVAWLILGELPVGPTDGELPIEAPPRPPQLRQRWVAVVLVAAAIGGYALIGFSHSASTCGAGFTWLGLEPIASDVVRVDNACIGVTGGSNSRVPHEAVLGDVGQMILDQNNSALKVHREHPDQPLITLVLLAAIDPPPGAGDAALAAVREQMAGMAVVQNVQLEKTHQAYEPLVRVLIANGGPELRHGRMVAEQLSRMAAADPGIVAVIGPNQSRATTADTLSTLGSAGLPTVSAVLTADSLVDVSPLYFGIAPQNSRQAAVTAAYVNQLLATGQQPTGRPLTRSARIYLSDDPGDIYSQNLADDLRVAFGRRGFEIETVAFTPVGATGGAPVAATHVTDAGIAGRGACDFDGVVLYAARGNPDFQTFIEGVADRCRDRPPYIIGGSDVTTYVADRTVSGANHSVPFDYLSHARAPELGGDVPVEASDFYARLDALFPYETTNRGRSLDGYAALTYDAAYTAVLAAGHLAREKIKINGQTVWPSLMSVTDAGGAQRRYRGVTGAIDFGGTVDRRVPLDKPVTIVSFADGAPSAARNIVCAGRDDPITQPWCPFDS